MSTTEQSEKVHSSELTKIAKGGFLGLTSSIGAKGILFFFTLALAKILGPADLGLYFLGATVCEFVTIFSNFGLQYGATRFVAIYQGLDDPQRMKGTVLSAAFLGLLASLLTGGTLFLSADLIASSLFHKPALGLVIRLLSVSIPFECLMKVFTASALGLKRMEHTAYIEHLAWNGLRLALALFFTCWLHLGLRGVALAYVASSVISAGLAFYYVNKLIPLIKMQTIPIFEVKKLLRFSIPMLLSTFVHDLMMKEDVLMLGYFVSAAEIGIYSVAVKILGLAEVIFQTFRPIFNPIVAELFERKEFGKLSHLLKLITRWDIMMSCPIFLCFWLFPGFLLNIFGKGFVGGANCLRLLAIASVADSISSYPSSIIFMSGRSYISLMNNFIALLINFVLNYLLMPGYGIIGAALATIAAVVAVALLRVGILYYLMRIQPLSRSLWKPLSAGFISSFIILAVNIFIVGSALTRGSSFQNTISTMSLISVFIILYFFFIYIFRLNEEELSLIKKIKVKIIN